MKTRPTNLLMSLILRTRYALKGMLLALTCFQLFFLGNPEALAQSQAAMTGNPEAPKTIEEQRAACTAADKYWDSQLNSCMTKQEAIDTASKAKACADASDPEECYLKEAETKTGVGQGDSFQNNDMEKIAQAVAGAYALFSMATLISVGDVGTGATESDLRSGGKSSDGKESSGKCTSKYIFAGTSAAWIAGDMYLKHRAKKNFETLAKEYETEASNKDQKAGDDGSFQAQIRAFHYLKQEQEQVKEQAKYRKFLQVAVVAGFGASLGFAIYEVTNPTARKCVKYNKTDQDLQNQMGPLTEAQQTTFNSMGSFKHQLLRMGSSAQVLVGAGIMLALNGYLIYHADKEMSRAADNIKAINKALETFSQYVAGFCPNGRDDLNSERCYCYNEDGTKNDNRTKSVICQNLFAADSINYALKNEKLTPLASGPRQGCLTVTGQFDVDCKCRTMVNNVTKQNACAKTPNSTAISGGFGAQLGAGQAMSTLGAFPQGANKALATLNEGALNKNAARSKSLVDSMIKQANQKGAKIPTMKDFEKQAEGMMLKAATNPSLTKNQATPLGFGLNNGEESRPESLRGALELAENKAEITKPSLTLTQATGTFGSNSSGDNGFKFSWNDAAAREGNKVQTFMDKKYDYKENDIVKRDDVSLWNVISKRYQTSGLRRLFGDEDE